MDPSVSLSDANALAPLRLLHLADSALPVGAMSHSFGLESLIAELDLRVADLPAFFSDWLAGTGMVEAVFCMRAWSVPDAAGWSELNAELTARKPARESRAASLALGRRFLRLAASLTGDLRLNLPGPAHTATAFGLVSGVLGIDRAAGVALRAGASGSEVRLLEQEMASLMEQTQATEGSTGELWAPTELPANGVLIRGLLRSPLRIPHRLRSLWNAARRQIWGRTAVLPRKTY